MIFDNAIKQSKELMARQRTYSPEVLPILQCLPKNHLSPLPILSSQYTLYTKYWLLFPKAGFYKVSKQKPSKIWLTNIKFRIHLYAGYKGAKGWVRMFVASDSSELRPSLKWLQWLNKMKSSDSQPQATNTWLKLLNGIEVWFSAPLALSSPP